MNEDVIGAFGQTSAQTGLIEPRFHGYLADAFDLRQESDYQPVIHVTNEQAREIVERAREFVAVCRSLCE